MEFEVDPLFQKTSASFDEGGSGGLLLSHLQCTSDACQLTLDSQAVAASARAEEEEDLTPHDPREFNAREIRDMLKNMQLQDRDICPAFSDFEFTNWNDSEGVSSKSTSSRGKKPSAPLI